MSLRLDPDLQLPLAVRGVEPSIDHALLNDVAPIPSAATANSPAPAAPDSDAEGVRAEPH